jgi:phosphohistidine phosphatase
MPYDKKGMVIRSKGAAMFVYIVRHAWAGERGDPRWPDDSERPLTPEGIDRFTAVVKALAERGFAPGRIATSPYVRCRQTADIIVKFLDGDPRIDELVALEPGSDIEELVDWSNVQDGKDVCWVGHSPDVEGLAAALIGDGGSNIRFAKGAAAAIEFDGPVAIDTGELHWLATAKLLGV